MDILVVGSGGREHAIVKALTNSKGVGRVYCAPGNAGIACDATCVPVKATDAQGVKTFALENNIGLVVVAPDEPLVFGMTDVLRAEGIRVFGPTKAAARLEGSKSYSKELMKRYNIPTAAYEVFDDYYRAVSYIDARNSYPVVIKADGLALGKGVTIAHSRDEAVEAIKDSMETLVFGDSGRTVVIEEFLEGPEVSVLSFCDGATVVPMVSAMDHKRAYDGDEGPNTGGMGTIAPNPFFTSEMAERCRREIFEPTVRAMIDEGAPFVGCLYFGLMLTKDGPKVIEYNCRFGDPETQVVLPLLKTDFLTVLDACVDGTLAQIDVEWSPDSAACVILASGGYPKKYTTGHEIKGLDDKGGAPGVTVIHAGTKCEDGVWMTSGGRVLGLTATAPTLQGALDKAYAACETVSFKGRYYRRDIGAKAIDA